MIKASFVFAALIAGAAAASIGSRDLVLHERRDDVPDGFTMQGAAPASTTLNLRLALAQTDIKGLQDKLMDVSTPSSANYGKHLTKEEVGSLYASALTRGTRADTTPPGRRVCRPAAGHR